MQNIPKNPKIDFEVNAMNVQDAVTHVSVYHEKNGFLASYPPIVGSGRISLGTGVDLSNSRMRVTTSVPEHLEQAGGTINYSVFYDTEVHSQPPFNPVPETRKVHAFELRLCPRFPFC